MVDVLNLRAPGHGEPEPAEEVDQLIGGLRQRMAMTELGDDAGKRDVDGAGRDHAALESRSGRFERGFQGLLDTIEPLAVSALARRLERLEPLLRGLYPALLLAQEFDPRSLDRVGTGRPLEGRQARASEACRARQARIPRDRWLTSELPRAIVSRDGSDRSVGDPDQADFTGCGHFTGCRAFTASSWRLSSSRTRATIASSVSGSWIASSDRLLRSSWILASLSP